MDGPHIYSDKIGRLFQERTMTVPLCCKLTRDLTEDPGEEAAFCGDKTARERASAHRDQDSSRPQSQWSSRRR